MFVVDSEWANLRVSFLAKPVPGVVRIMLMHASTIKHTQIFLRHLPESPHLGLCHISLKIQNNPVQKWFDFQVENHHDSDCQLGKAFYIFVYMYVFIQIIKILVKHFLINLVLKISVV